MNFLATTRSVPIEQRRDYWSNIIARHCGKFNILYPEKKYEGTFDARSVCGLSFARIRQAPCSMSRPSRLIDSCPVDAYFLISQFSGRCGITQEGRTAYLRPGDVTLVYTRLPMEVEFSTFSVQVAVHIPAEALALDETVRARLAQTYPRAIALIIQKIISCGFDYNGLFDLNVRETFLDTLLLLVRGVERPEAGEARDAMSDDLYRAIQSYVSEHVMDEELTPAVIARVHNISERKLYRLFAMRGVPPSQYIRKVKLSLVAQEIAAAERSGSLITQLAYKYGFSDASNFSRAFKMEFGVSPRDYQNGYSP